MSDFAEGGTRSTSLVSHVVVVGFHAKLGNRIEFAYPRLRGETNLRSPRLSDTFDISDPSPGSPSPYATPICSKDEDTPGSSPFSPPLPPAVKLAQVKRGSAQPSRGSSSVRDPSSPSAAFDDLETAIAVHGSGGITSAKTPPSAAGQYATPERQIQRRRHFESSGGKGSGRDGDSAGLRATAKGDWGVLPLDWAHLPFMAIPDGAHELEDDLVFFSLPPDVHCVSCFRQVDAIEAVTHSASSSRRKEEDSVAARGSVQKSIVLLCRRPLFGFLAARLVPAVRAYFDQGDFSSTECLAELYHSLNMSLAHPSLGLTTTLFQGVSLCELLRNVGPQVLAVVKLILLEKRVVFYSAPVKHASDAVVAFASLLPGALDSIAPTMPALDSSEEARAHGFPLALFGARDRSVLQPYAPLPAITDVLCESGGKSGCVLGTSHNLGMLLASTAAAATRKAAAAVAASSSKSSGAAPKRSTPRRQTENLVQPGHSAPLLSSPPLVNSSGTPSSSTGSLDVTHSDKSEGSGLGKPRVSSRPPPGAASSSPSPPITVSTKGSPAAGSGGNGRLPVVDALVNLGTGKVSVAGSIEPLCRITRHERRFMRDLMVAASVGAGPRVSNAEMSADDYIRDRIREYLYCLLGSVADVPGVLGGPRGGESWSSEMASHLDLSALEEYNSQFVHAWLQTRNAGVWARRCDSKLGFPRPVPAPELDKSLMQDSLLPVERVAAGLTGIRDSLNSVSSKAAEGISSIFARLEVQLAKGEESGEAKPVAKLGNIPATKVPSQLQLSRSAPPSVGRSAHGVKPKK